MMSPKTVLITGVSSGLGQAMMRAFLRQGWQVYGVTRDKSHIIDSEPLLTIIECAHHQTAIAQKSEVISRHIHNGLDVLVNNAGYALVGALESLSDENINQQLQVNLLSHISLTRLCIPYLRKTQGKILNISSLFGKMSCPFHSLYCASKHAIEGFSEALHYELKPHNIQCSIIVPGRHHTQFGANMAIQTPASPYHAIYDKQYNGFYRLKAKLTHKKGNDPDFFANKIIQLAQQPYLPCRIAVNHDSKIPSLIQKYVPGKLYAYMQNKLFAQYFYPKKVL